MSHVVLEGLVYKDLECLKIAAKACGLEFRENQKTHRWYGKWMKDYNSEDAAFQNGINAKDYGKCLHAIGVPGNSQAYEIGIVKNPEGEGYRLMFDFFAGGRGLMDHISGPSTPEQLAKNLHSNQNSNRLAVAYAEAVAEKVRVMQGLNQVGSVEVLPDGSKVIRYSTPVARASATVQAGSAAGRRKR